MRIIIGDSNPLEAKGLEALCEGMTTCTAVESYERCADLLQSKVNPHVVILDFSADGYGMDSITRVASRFPKAAILAITPIQSATTVMHAVKAGITGYVKKDCSINEIQQSIAYTAQSQPFYCGDIVRLMKTEGVDLLSLDAEDLDCSPILLTDREVEILRYIASGHTNAEIADLLFLSGHTVNTHRKNILGKIGAKNVAGAVIFAVKEGIIDPERFEFTRQ